MDINSEDIKKILDWLRAQQRYCETKALYHEVYNNPDLRQQYEHEAIAYETTINAIKNGEL